MGACMHLPSVTCENCSNAARWMWPIDGGGVMLERAYQAMRDERDALAQEVRRLTDAAYWSHQLTLIEADCKRRNWDSYNADPVDQRAIDAARALCESLMVFPTKNGGVTVNMAGEDVQIELTDEGQLEDFYLSITDVGLFLRTALVRAGDEDDEVLGSDDRRAV